MGVDRLYTTIDNKFVRFYVTVPDERCTYYWVDVCHTYPMIDERYLFSDLSLAQDFFLEGWKDRQFLDDNELPLGIDHIGIYSHGHELKLTF